MGKKPPEKRGLNDEESKTLSRHNRQLLQMATDLSTQKATYSGVTAECHTIFQEGKTACPSQCVLVVKKMSTFLNTSTIWMHCE